MSMRMMLCCTAIHHLVPKHWVTRCRIFRKDTNLAEDIQIISCELLQSSYWMDENVPGRHIVRISGHKSEASIKTYARKLSSARKRSIFDTFNKGTFVQGKRPTKIGLH